MLGLVRYSKNPTSALPVARINKQQLAQACPLHGFAFSDRLLTCKLYPCSDQARTPFSFRLAARAKQTFQLAGRAANHSAAAARYPNKAMRRPHLRHAVAALLVAYTSGETDRVLVDVAANSRRCLGEEFPEDALGRWKFSVAGVVKHGDLKRNSEAAQKVRATVKDPSKKLLWSAALNDDATNAPAFSFTATTPGLYRACVENRHTKPQRVAITVEQGWGVRDYAAVGEGVFGPVEKQLDDSDHMLRDIAAEMDAALNREERLREGAESGRDRVELFGVVSMGVLFVTALWQVVYLRSFFRSKKLL